MWLSNRCPTGLIQYKNVVFPIRIFHSGGTTIQYQKWKFLYWRQPGIIILNLAPETLLRPRQIDKGRWVRYAKQWITEWLATPWNLSSLRSVAEQQILNQSISSLGIMFPTKCPFIWYTSLLSNLPMAMCVLCILWTIAFHVYACGDSEPTWRLFTFSCEEGSYQNSNFVM